MNSGIKPSWAMTFALLLALTGLFFTSGILLVWVMAITLLWPHFVAWRYARDASGVWLVRLLFYGGIFAFYGGRPGVGADWIFDAQTFNTIGLIAASEAVLQAWREPPPDLRFQPLLVLHASLVFLAACNTFDDRYIRFLAPLFIVSTLLALHDLRFRESGQKSILSTLQSRRVFALLFVVCGGAALHYSLLLNKDEIQNLGVRLIDRRILDTIGLSNQPRLSSTFNRHGSTRRVLLIRGVLNDPHLRAAAFESYSGGRWSPPVSDRAKKPFFEPAGNDIEGTHIAQITKLEELDNLIFAPLNAVEIIAQPGSSFDWNENIGPIICEDPAPYSYEVRWSEEGDEIGVPLHQGVLCAPPSPDELENLLEIAPEIDPRVQQLAFRIAGDEVDDADKIEAVIEYLITNHKYSRTTRRGPGDPVSSFLLEGKAAHCEYFASAAVILLRCVGVPARYATGFLAHEKEGEYTTVRQRDAHAWAEAWVEGIGWVNVEATPADGTPEAQPQVSWWQRKWEQFQDDLKRWREEFAGFSRAQIFGLIVFVTLVWLAERWRQRRRRKSVAVADTEYSTSTELAKIAARFGKILQKRKIIAYAGQTWSERLEMERAAPTEYSTFIETYNRARFGGAGDQSTHDALQQDLDRLEKIAAKGDHHAHRNQTGIDAK